MQQLEFINRKLIIYGYKAQKVNAYFILGSSEVILLTTLLSSLFAVCYNWDFPIYVLNGVVLPLYFAKYGVELQGYWVWFAALLLLRKVVTSLYLLDSLLLVCLWHPNINFAAYLNQNLLNKGLPIHSKDN